MTDASYKRSYKIAIDELTKLMEQYEELESQMDALRQRMKVVRKGVTGLAALSGAHPEEDYPHLFPRILNADVGFTDAVREVLKSVNGISYSPVQVRDELKARGFDLSKYKNPLASIHTILKRLHMSKEVSLSTPTDGGMLYSWNTLDDEIPF